MTTSSARWRKNNTSEFIDDFSTHCFALVSFYVLVVTSLMSPQTRIVTVSNITPSLFNYLRLNYGQTLSCPCSADTVVYSNFVSNTISFDPVCSSVFISRQWIEALYMTNASQYISMDFRATASSQVSENLFERAFVVVDREKLLAQSLRD